MTETFARLLAKRDRQEYDDEYLQLLIAYHEAHPFSEAPAVFMGYYALAYGNVDVALEYAQKAFSKRPVNFEVWKLWIRCCEQTGDTRRLMYFQGLCRKFYSTPLHLSFTADGCEDELGLLTLGMGIGNYAPFAKCRAHLVDGKIEMGQGLFIGEFLPRIYDRPEYWYWIGCYKEREDFDAKGWLSSAHQYDPEFVGRCGVEFAFDMMKAKEVQDVTIVPDGTPVVVPVGGKEAGQSVHIASEDGEGAIDDTSRLAKWSFHFYRLDAPTRISSEQPFVMGEPIPLVHSPRRHPVVINILIDALSWGVMRERGYQDVPNICQFFEKGVIFDQNFSTSEYTFPSFAAIETSMYPQHNQIFNEYADVELSPRIVTMSEQMKRLGYYCTCVLGADGMYEGVERGYDRVLGNFYDTPAYRGVERAIRQLEAFGECDQFLQIHTMDVHVWSSKSVHLLPVTQTKLPLRERLTGGNTDDASVYIAGYELYRQQCLDGIRLTDRNLGVLFDYLEAHYAPDDYVVNLYSDHGVSVFGDHWDLMSDHHVGAALMARGAGIPARGFVRDEVTSTLDLYPILAYEAGFDVPDDIDGNLPAALGGRARRYAISNTLYPGQVLRCAIRTLTHEFQVMSHEFIDEDGTVDLGGIETALYRRSDHVRIEDAALQEEFLRVFRAHTASIDRRDPWPSMREARPDWYGTAERKERHG